MLCSSGRCEFLRVLEIIIIFPDLYFMNPKYSSKFENDDFNLQYIFFRRYISGRKTSSRVFFMRFNKKKKVQNIVRMFIFMCYESIYTSYIYQRLSFVTKRELILGVGKDHDL